MAGKKKKAPNMELPVESKKRSLIEKVLSIFFLAVVVPLIIIVLIEVLLRATGYGKEWPMFSETRVHGRDYITLNPEYSQKYFLNESFTFPHYDLFLKKKPENAFRIFVLGSSTVYGFPYHQGLSFPSILDQRLTDAFPEKHIEVINLAVTAINSYSLADRIDEILEQQPDALLIYAGHNEFYGALGAGAYGGMGNVHSLKKLHLFMLRYRFYQGIRSLADGISGGGVPELEAESQQVATLMERITQNRNIAYQGRVYNAAHRHFELNMGSILRKAKTERVPVFIGDVVSNIGDLPPFVKEENREKSAALIAFEQAQGLLQQGLADSARVMFAQARNLDGIRFRASDDINRTIEELSEEFNAFFVPVGRRFKSESPNGIPGNTLFTEHVHPTITGYHVMADVFYTSLLQSGLMGETNPDDGKPASWYQQSGTYTILDSITADLRIQHLMSGWPFQPRVGVNNFKQEYIPSDIIDSLAFLDMVYDDITAADAHRRLATHYQTRGLLNEAARELQVNTFINPWELRNYIESGNLFMQAANLQAARDVFVRSLALTREPFVLLQLAEISLKLDQPMQAFEYLDQLEGTGSQYNTLMVAQIRYQAFLESGQSTEAQQLLVKYPQLLSETATTAETILFTPSIVRDQIDQAFTSLRQNNPQKGLELLLEANRVLETGLANRFIGEIYLSQENDIALVYLTKAWPDFQADAGFMNTYCYAAIRFEQYELAARLLPTLKQLDPNNANIERFESAIRSQEGV